MYFKYYFYIALHCKSSDSGGDGSEPLTPASSLIDTTTFIRSTKTKMVVKIHKSDIDRSVLRQGKKCNFTSFIKKLGFCKPQ